MKELVTTFLICSNFTRDIKRAKPTTGVVALVASVPVDCSVYFQLLVQIVGCRAEFHSLKVSVERTFSLGFNFQSMGVPVTKIFAMCCDNK